MLIILTCLTLTTCRSSAVDPLTEKLISKQTTWHRRYAYFCFPWRLSVSFTPWTMFQHFKSEYCNMQGKQNHILFLSKAVWKAHSANDFTNNFGHLNAFYQMAYFRAVCTSYLHILIWRTYYTIIIICILVTEFMLIDDYYSNASFLFLPLEGSERICNSNWFILEATVFNYKKNNSLIIIIFFIV